MLISITSYEFWKEAFQPHSELHSNPHTILDTEHCPNLWGITASPGSVHYTNFLKKFLSSLLLICIWLQNGMIQAHYARKRGWE